MYAIPHVRPSRGRSPQFAESQRRARADPLGRRRRPRLLLPTSSLDDTTWPSSHVMSTPAQSEAPTHQLSFGTYVRPPHRSRNSWWRGLWNAAADTFMNRSLFLLLGFSSPGSLQIHAAQKMDKGTRAVAVPIGLSTAFVFPDPPVRRTPRSHPAFGSTLLL